MPMEIKIVFTDQTETIVSIFNNAQTQSFSFTAEKEVEYVQLDPNDWILKNVQFDPEIVDVEALAKDQIQVFPNPASQNIRIMSSLPNEEIVFKIFDLNGSEKLCKTQISSAEGQIELDIDNLSSGIYILNVITEGKHYVQKISIIK